MTMTEALCLSPSNGDGSTSMRKSFFFACFTAALVLATVSAHAANEDECSRTGRFINMKNVAGNFVAVRTAPASSANQIGSFYYGDPVTVCQVSGDWTFVRSNTGLSGWTFSKLLNVEESVAKAERDPQPVAPAIAVAPPPPKTLPPSVDRQLQNNAEAASAIAACDKFAAHPDDRQRRAPGIESSSLRLDDALAACTSAAAVSEDPVTHYQLGRIIEAMQEIPEALDEYTKASRQSHSLAAYHAGQLALENHIFPSGLPAEINTWYSFSAMEFLISAKQGDPDAKNQLGYIGERLAMGHEAQPSPHFRRPRTFYLALCFG